MRRPLCPLPPADRVQPLRLSLSTSYAPLASRGKEGALPVCLLSQAQFSGFFLGWPPAPVPVFCHGASDVPSPNISPQVGRWGPPGFWPCSDQSLGRPSRTPDLSGLVGRVTGAMPGWQSWREGGDRPVGPRHAAWASVAQDQQLLSPRPPSSSTASPSTTSSPSPGPGPAPHHLLRLRGLPSQPPGAKDK